MYIQQIMPICLKNSNYKTIVNHKENLKTETNSTILPSFVDAKCYANINFKADIHEYANEGDLDGVKRELAKGEDLNIKNIWGWTPLYEACVKEHLDTVKYLCEQEGIDLNIQDKDGWAPLHEAGYTGHIDIVKLLCEQGADLNIQDKDGVTPLHYACNREHLDTVKYFCEQKGIDLNIQDKDGVTPLHKACYNGHIDIVKLLCEQEGIDVNIKDKHGDTPLHDACYNEHIDIVKLLCKQNGIDINIQNIQGETPLHNACYYGSSDIVKFLCEQDGINLTKKNKSGKTPWDIAKDKGYQYFKWCKELEEKTKYQLAHPETIRKNKPLSKKQAEKQAENDQTEINKLKQELTQKEQDYATKIETLARLLGQDIEITAENFKKLVNEALVAQIRKNEQEKAQIILNQEREKLNEAYQAKVDELKQKHQSDEQDLQTQKAKLKQEHEKLNENYQAKMAELEEKIQTYEELMNAAQNYIQAEVELEKSGFQALYGIEQDDESVEKMGYVAQIIRITDILRKNKDKHKLQGTNNETPENIVKALQDNNGKISNDGLEFINRIFESCESVTADDLENSIKSVKNENGYINLEKVGLFLASIAWGTAIKTAIEKVKTMPKIK